MFQIELAGLNIQINNRYDLCRSFCEKYLSYTKTIDFQVTADDLSMAKIREAFIKQGDTSMNDDVVELNCIHYKIYPKLPLYGRFWLHAAVVELEGAGYAFSAPSGYGKTTHAMLWMKQFAGKAHIVNGDNPIFRKDCGVYYAYGTPFAGKEGYQIKTRVPLRGLCYLKHSDSNAIYRLDPSMAFAELVRSYQTIFTEENQEDYLGLLQDFVETVPVYQLCCNMDSEAALVAYRGMYIKGEMKNDED